MSDSGAWLLEKYGTPQAVYDVGYEEGGSSREADWQFALSEYADLPDDVEIDPMQIAAYITQLQRDLDRYVEQYDRLQATRRAERRP